MKHFDNDNEFDSFLRGKLKDASLSPPNSERVWKDIQYTLKQTPRSKWRFRAAASIFPILALLLFYYAVSYTSAHLQRVEGSQLAIFAPVEPLTNQSSVIATESTHQKEKLKERTINSLYPKKADQANTTGSYVTTTPTVGSVNNGDAVSLQTNRPLFGLKEDNDTHLKMDANLAQEPSINRLDIPLLANMNGVLAIPASAGTPRESIQSKRKTVRNFYVGIHRNITNNWILNQNTYQIFGSDHLGLAMFWGGSWGNHIGWDLRKNVTIEIGANWLASHGQKQRDMALGRKASFEVDMIYHQFPLMIKKKHTPIIFGRRVTAYAEGGIQYARLLLARQQVNYADKGGIYTRFNEDEISILAGYSLDIPLSPRLFLNAALRGRISNNINAKDWRVDGDYGKSHNLAVGLTVGLNYRLAAPKR